MLIICLVPTENFKLYFIVKTYLDRLYVTTKKILKDSMYFSKKKKKTATIMTTDHLWDYLEHVEGLQ